MKSKLSVGDSVTFWLMKSNYKKLGDYIRLMDERNTDGSVTRLLGVSIEKKFIESIANTIGTDMSIYKIVRKGQFAYGPVTSRNGDKVSIALLEEEKCIISSSYSVFEIINTKELLPEYLNLWFKRPEFDRYARFHSHGSAREIFDWEEMCNVELPVPEIEEQRKIVEAYNTIERRIALKRKINDNLESQMSFLFIKKFEPLSFNCDSKQHLSDIMTFDNGFAFSSSEYLLEGQYKIITIGNVCDGYIDTTNVNHLQTISDKIKRSALLYIGDIIISLTGNVGRTAIVKESNLLLNQRVARIVARDKMYKGFLYCLFRQQSTKTFLETISRGTAQANLSPVELLNTKTNYNHDDMIEFTKIVTPMINAILVNSNEIAELLIFRRAFLSELSR